MVNTTVSPGSSTDPRPLSGEAHGRSALSRHAGALATVLLLLLAACGTDDPDGKDAKTAVDAGLDGAGGDGSDNDSGDDSADTGSGDAEDTGDDLGDADAEQPDVPIDVSECVTSTDCQDLSLSACQQAACEAGMCKAVKNPDACCTDADCDDKFECTLDKCDQDAHVCGNSAIVNCCSGKVTLLKTSFEQGGFEADFKDTPGAVNGNVHWQLSATRTHTGKTSLYFGNECHVYDNAATSEGGCKPTGDGTAVSTALATHEYALPKDKKVQLHFWLWLDAEPLYTTSLKVGDCKNPCPTGSTCALIAGASQCLPEKDVLQVNVLFGDKVLPVFNSTTIAKTTKGLWQHIAIDLSTWAGQPVKLQWAFNTGTGLKNGFEGLYLDDIVVETICAQGGALCNAKTACNDDANGCTLDGCSEYANSAGNGVCFYDKKVGCCANSGDCDDGNECTVDSCVGGLCQDTPDTSKAGCCKPDVLAVDEFDSGGLESWSSLSQNSMTIKWRVDGTGGIDPSTGKIGGSSLYFGNEQFTGYDDPALGKDIGPKGMLCTTPLQLKQGTLYNLVQFDLMLETEWTGQPTTGYANPPIAGKAKFDFFSVQVYAAGQFVEAWSSDAIFGSTEGKYLPVTVILDAWQGKLVQVCLAFDSGDGEQNSFGGVHIDNFAVKAACSKKACYFDNECSALACGACEVAACSPTGCACSKIANCCVADADCTDGDALCTTDTCGPDGACVFTPTGADGCPK